MYIIFFIEFGESHGGDLLFKFGIGKHDDGVFKVSTLLECSKCWTYLSGIYVTPGYCLSVGNDKHRIITGTKLTLFLHYHKNGTIEVYILNYYFGYSYRTFQFKPFQKQPPKVYIEKIHAKDIVISSTKIVNIFNLKEMIIALLATTLFFLVNS